jgi:hypothetical protein
MILNILLGLTEIGLLYMCYEKAKYIYEHQPVPPHFVPVIPPVNPPIIPTGCSNPKSQPKNQKITFQFSNNSSYNGYIPEESKSNGEYTFIPYLKSEILIPGSTEYISAELEAPIQFSNLFTSGNPILMMSFSWVAIVCNASPTNVWTSKVIQGGDQYGNVMSVTNQSDQVSSLSNQYGWVIGVPWTAPRPSAGTFVPQRQR